MQTNTMQPKPETIEDETAKAVDPATPLFGGSRAELLLAVISELGEAHQRTANIVDGLPLLCRRSRQTLIAEMCAITTAIDSFGDALMSEPNASRQGRREDNL